mmetsp:Transcript_64137/g.153000  ORF Transcript_64137/g.153000 Transcript_64137/m.153000 type:complete len:216 (-) Transcript_64137:83-730(-)
MIGDRSDEDGRDQCPHLEASPHVRDHGGSGVRLLLHQLRVLPLAQQVACRYLHVGEEHEAPCHRRRLDGQRCERSEGEGPKEGHADNVRLLVPSEKGVRVREHADGPLDRPGCPRHSHHRLTSVAINVEGLLAVRELHQPQHRVQQPLHEHIHDANLHGELPPEVGDEHIVEMLQRSVRVHHVILWCWIFRHLVVLALAVLLIPIRHRLIVSLIV